jgi:8-oxo-dGTP pyrophosphatase MutT (NUDIX family)
MPKKLHKVSKPLPKASTKRQVAALPFRQSASGSPKILIITSRTTGRFVISKGWPMKGLPDPDAAAREAFEETGMVGKVSRKPIGHYSYWKRLGQTFKWVKVAVYPLKVKGQRQAWPEFGHRRMAWLSPEDAAALVDEPALATLIRAFDQHTRKRPKAEDPSPE